MENIIFNELKVRGYSVDVGVVERRDYAKSGKESKIQMEVDFVANAIDKTYYVQSALNIDEKGKRLQEIAPLIRIPDSFKKIVVVKDHIMPWNDDNGILYIGIQDFLLSENNLSSI